MATYPTIIGRDHFYFVRLHYVRSHGAVPQLNWETHRLTVFSDPPHLISEPKNWTMDERITLVKGITEDQGLTLLKIGIARILLLRALFSSSELTYQHRRRALADGQFLSSSRPS